MPSLSLLLSPHTQSHSETLKTQLSLSELKTLSPTVPPPSTPTPLSVVDPCWTFAMLLHFLPHQFCHQLIQFGIPCSSSISPPHLENRNPYLLQFVPLARSASSSHTLIALQCHCYGDLVLTGFMIYFFAENPSRALKVTGDTSGGCSSLLNSIHPPPLHVPFVFSSSLCQISPPHSYFLYFLLIFFYH